MGRIFRIWCLVFVFCSVISFPIINSISGFVTDSENLENRRMTARPAFDITFLDPFPALYEKFFNDHFSFRSLMIKWYNLFKLFVFKKSPFPEKVIIGRNRWLFMGGNDINTYLGKDRLTNRELEELKLELEYRQDYLAKLGCKFYFTLAPAKENIYSEFIPYNLYRYKTQSWGEQLFSYLVENSNIASINLFPVMRKNKDKQIYFKLDTHWNDIGALYATNEICRVIALDLPVTGPMSLADFDIHEMPKSEGNSVQIIGYSELFSDTQFNLIPKKPFLAKGVLTPNYIFWKESQPLGITIVNTGISSETKLMILGDSFTNWLFPYLSEHFNTTINTSDEWRYVFNKKLVEYEKPDAYLLVIHEPLIRELLKHQSRLGKNN